MMMTCQWDEGMMQMAGDVFGGWMADAANSGGDDTSNGGGDGSTDGGANDPNM